MGIALIVTDRDCTELADALATLVPQTSVQVWPDIHQPEAVKLAVLWKQPQDVLTDMSQLQAVCSLGAGIDFIEDDASIPQQLPIYKTVTPRLQQEMAQYVLAYMLERHRETALYRRQQQQSQWRIHDVVEKPTAGLLGLGDIAAYVADLLLKLGFNVKAFTHNSQHETIPTFHGDAGLRAVLSDSDYIVNLLPLKPQTQGLLNFNRLAWCKRQPLLINAGRGGHVVEVDLIRALDEGVLSAAVLDVFVQEPLPTEHPFWQHPKITISPHNAARSDTQQTATAIADLYSRLFRPDQNV